LAQGINDSQGHLIPAVVTKLEELGLLSQQMNDAGKVGGKLTTSTGSIDYRSRLEY
jgi:hypothetical protein